MTDLLFIVVVITIATGVLLGSILTTYCCCIRYFRHQLTSSSQPSKRSQRQQQDPHQDYLHSIIVNQHIHRHPRPNSAISFISDNYHNNMTLMVSPHRLAMLEQQQQQQRQEPATLVIENPLISLATHTEEPATALSQSFVYDNPTLELGDLSTNGAM